MPGRPKPLCRFRKGLPPDALPQSLALQLALDAICPPAIRLTLCADTAIDPAAPGASLETTMPLGCAEPPAIVSAPDAVIATLPPAPRPVVAELTWAPAAMLIAPAMAIVISPARPAPPVLVDIAPSLVIVSVPAAIFTVPALASLCPKESW